MKVWECETCREIGVSSDAIIMKFCTQCGNEMYQLTEKPSLEVVSNDN